MTTGTPRFAARLLTVTALTLLAGCAPPESAGVTGPPPPATPSPSALASQATSRTPAAQQPVYLRLNQVGYLPGEAKQALALTDADLGGQVFRVLNSAGQAVFSAQVGADRGAYGDFAHLYTLDFSPVVASGAYKLLLNDASSPPLLIDPQAYTGLVPLSLEFFRVQRCGDTDPLGHGPCHLRDGRAAGGQRDGQPVDATGGWHDAGDYIKFMITTGYATAMMLAVYQRHPQPFSSTAVLDEARIGLDWMLKMWDPLDEVLYYQVADESDHRGWRLPEGDDTNRPQRPVWACEPGRGANVAGKAAAALALAAVLWNEQGSPAYDPQRATTYLQAAEQLYRYGQARPAAQASNPTDFYQETTWQDDMALAAAELYRATGVAAYLKDAREYALAAGSAGGLDWASLHALAHYEIARLDPSYVPSATAFLSADLEAARTAAEANPFGVGVPEFFWGSAETMAGLALEALWYQDLTGDTRYRALADGQRDFVLGRNLWGVCWVSGAGTNWPRHPHHQVADLNGLELRGFWDEGAVPRSVFAEQGIGEMGGADHYAAFQSDAAVYHDNTADYVTNEPTITANATGLALAAWYAAPR